MMSSMKVKTSVTLSPEILEQLDRETGNGSSRSELIEQILANYFRQQRRDARNSKDAAIYATMYTDTAYRCETEEVLELQASWQELDDGVGALAQG